MEGLDISSLGSQLGLAGVLAYVVYLQGLRNDKRIDERDATFREFVNSFNSKQTELIVEATNAIKESSLLIKECTQVMENWSKKK